MISQNPTRIRTEATPQGTGLVLAILTGLIIPQYSLPVEARRAKNIEELLGRQFIKTQKDRDEHILLNMKKTRKAAENYAAFQAGKYPTKMDNALKSYFPLGNCDGKSYSAFTIPYNPYTEKPAWPELYLDRKPKTRGEPGVIELHVDRTANTYRIFGRLADGSLIKNSRGKPMLLKSSKIQACLANARVVQWAAEHYNENVKTYPIGVTRTFKSYFPGGDPKTKRSGKPPINPYTGKREWPVTGKVKRLRKTRASAPTALKKGSIEYSCLPGGRDYAIRIGGKEDKALVGLMGQKSTLVIARDGDGSGHETKF